MSADTEQLAMRDSFYALVDYVQAQLKNDEFFMANFYAESSDFVRMNQAQVRQPGSVSQAELALTWICSGASVNGTVAISGDAALDCDRVERLIVRLRASLTAFEPDPYLLYSENRQDSEHFQVNALPSSDECIDAITKRAAGLDFVGIFASGSMHFGFGNALGQRNWHSTSNFNLDWSLYSSHDPAVKDRAVKCNYAGRQWQSEVFDDKVRQGLEHLSHLKKPVKTLSPGEYRVYLAPAAVDEIMNLLGWGGFSQASWMTKASALQLLGEGKRFSPLVNISENTQEGVAPLFQSSGYIKPDNVGLISQGQKAELLCSPRTAKEYDVLHNGSDSETPEALAMEAGDLAEADVLAALGTGVYVSNLWYLNYSDRASGRVTGMTRFACFWVEDGKIQAPINVMRFDDSIFNMFGARLERLGNVAEMFYDPSSYERRSASCSQVPGALISALKMTL
ncbi:MAG: Zn-dependent protease [Alteromonadaceae bacterium]|nr:MAG: Zn-dependent protease [Alteromonadaceae bacterium]